jgi:RND family efflux transporter MFP subunit
MPDKNPDAGPPVTMGEGLARDELLRHTIPVGLKRYGRLALIAAVAIAALGVGWRMWKSHTTAQWTDDQAVPTVQIVKLAGAKSGSLNLPGEVQAFASAPIYAQVTGYMQKWYFDIGATVKKGALLAQIDPRTYQAALDQARGALARDNATLANARVDLSRYQTLSAQNAISAQQLATQQATVNAQAGIVEADRAQVAQASINLAYTRIIAPFDGTVTTRAVDVGNLVTAGTPSSATPLFTVSDQSKLRIYVRVPQNYASYIRPGMAVSFTVPQYQGRVFEAKLVASAGAVASTTGTVLVQFGLDNPDGALQPGAYAEVKFPLPAGAHGIRVPATALMFRDEGMQVATVDAANHVKLKTIVIARDMGAAVDVASGISPKDRIIDNPTDALQEGDEVKVANK